MWCDWMGLELCCYPGRPVLQDYLAARKCSFLQIFLHDLQESCYSARNLATFLPILQVSYTIVLRKILAENTATVLDQALLQTVFFFFFFFF